MIDWDDKDAIYNAIKDADGDNKRAYNLARMIKQHIKHIKQVKATAGDEINKTTDAGRNGNKAKSGKNDGLDPLDLSSSDDAVRMHARQLLIDRLNSREITAAEFAQFKDVFGLANAGSNITFETVDFDQPCSECAALKQLQVAEQSIDEA